jgi:ankyrin repeat protein
VESVTEENLPPGFLQNIEDLIAALEDVRGSGQPVLLETDCAQSLESQLRDVTLEDMCSNEVFFDPAKRRNESNNCNKKDTGKRLKSSNDQVTSSVTNQNVEMANRCIQHIFHIPHLFAFGLSPSQILLNTCKKIPEILTGEDGWGDSPLNNALLKDKNDAARFLIDMLIECNATAHLNDANDDGHSPLILLANSTCDEELVVKLLQYGADITAVDTMQRSVFHYAVCNKKEKMLEYLLNHAKLRGQLHLLEQEDVSRMTPFHMGVFNEDQPSMLQQLLHFLCIGHGNPNHRSSQNVRSALHMAIIHKLFCSLDTLLNSEDSGKVDVNSPMLDGRRPLQVAIEMKIPDHYLQLLKARNANPGEYVSDSEDERISPGCSTTTIYDVDVASVEPILAKDIVPPLPSHCIQIDLTLDENTHLLSDDEMNIKISSYERNELFQFSESLLTRAPSQVSQSRVLSLYGTMKKNKDNLVVLQSLAFAIWKEVVRR